MELIRNTDFAGERPLFGSKDLRLENVTVQEGESALKCCSNIEAVGCRFEAQISLLACRNFPHRQLRVHSRSARCAMVFQRSCHDRHTSRCP